MGVMLVGAANEAHAKDRSARIVKMRKLLLSPLVQYAVKEKGLDWLKVIEEEPDAGLEWRSGAARGLFGTDGHNGIAGHRLRSTV